MNYSILDTTKIKNKLFRESNLKLETDEFNDLLQKSINYRIKENIFILLKQYTLIQKTNKNKDEKKNITIKCYYCGHDKLKSLHKRGVCRSRWYYHKQCIKCNKYYNYRYLLSHKKIYNNILTNIQN